MRDLLIWCSVHQPTQQQMNELTEMGQLLFLRDIDPEMMTKISDSPSTEEELEVLAQDFMRLTSLPFEVTVDKNITLVQPAGSPAFQLMLGRCMDQMQIQVMYAHSERVSVDESQPDGTVKKVSTFQHKGWIRL